ncbi:hypothetical protein CJA_2502 [Cellvibrio japonicus Ueda107]|uniref:Big-1 domain-containing protein n=2 Tax=Cellvibrio japonicus TaxID=155077 RepID=B3PKY9_CELJU|nr:hypothetical protein CJA_2502 [Cellvibrio japonicus Ueda107]
MVLDTQGKPILVEYNEDGEEVSVVNWTGEFKDLSIISVHEYRMEKARYDVYMESRKDDLAKDAEIVSVEKFKQTDYKAADGKTNIIKPQLKSYVKSVLVRGQSNRILTSGHSGAWEPLVLLSFSVDLSQEAPGIPEKGTLLLNDKGQVIHSTVNNIAPRVGFFGDPNESQEFYSGIRKYDDEIFGPVKHVKVYISPEVFPGSLALTDSQGKYSMRFYLPYCPGGFDYTTDVWAELHYANFSPYGAPLIPYYLRRQDWTYCYDPLPVGGFLGLAAYVNASAMAASLSTYFYSIDLKVDVMFLSGRIFLRNPDGSPISVTNITEYEAETADNKRISQNHYDFDGDGEYDTVVLGRMVDQPQEDGSTKKVFEPYPAESLENLQDPAALQGIYLSSSIKKGSGATDSEPDFVRLADTEKKFQSNGLLKSISKDDFKNTDILVFRESTGKLVLERQGLKDEEISSRVDIGLGEGEQSYFYRLMLRGPMDHNLNIGAINRSKNWEDWAEDYRLAEPLRKREADHLKSGEWIRLVVINRATGYVGTQRIQLTDASMNSGSLLSVKLEDTFLEPPNLKIWAERKYTLDKGVVNAENKDKEYLVGQEGAALTSDTAIEVFTEWLDHDGRPLPEGLSEDNGKQYGLTGRLARAAGNQSLVAVSPSDLANFPIPPGRNTQVLKISDNLTTPEHFYVHVSGTQKNEKPDFSGTNFGVGLEGRPQKFTPFLTPLFDENDTWQIYKAYRDLKREQDDDESSEPVVDLIKPLPTYSWSYRPEYQFSQYELEIAEINRITERDDGVEEKTNIFDAKTPVIASTDKLIEVLYSLFGAGVDRLNPIDGPQDLVLALGEEEIRLSVEPNQQIRFENIEHLAGLSPEDFLTIRLYSNQDAGNILWEYAFEHLILDTQLAGFDANAGRTLYVSADDPVVPLQARLLGYADRSEKIKTPIVVNWSAPGASLETTSESDDDQGVFFNEVRLPPVTGASTRVAIKLVGVEETKAELPKFEVVPGVPAQISVDQSQGNLSVGGLGQTTVTFVIRDKNNNLVADGTGVSFFPEGALLTVSADTATSSGRASVTMEGGDYAEQARLTIHVGDQSHTIDLNVRPLNVALSAPTNLEAGKSGPVVVTVTDQDGAPAAGIDVSLGSTYGYLQATELITDANGIATTTVTAPGSQGIGEITAQVLRTSVKRQAFSVNYGNPEERDLEVANAAVIGDRAGNGTFTYDRFDGVGVHVPYETTADIQVKGAVGEPVTVTLGDSHDPNLAPIAAYFFNQIDDNTLDDDGGRFPLKGMQVSPQQNARLGAGTSMAFNPGTSKAWGDGVSALGLAQNTGFTLEVYPKGEVGGDLVNLGQGGQRLSYSGMRFSYRVRTTEGDFTVTSNPIFPARWYQVSARYQGGKLELWVNDQRYETPASGAVDYLWSGNSSGNDDPEANHDLVIAGDFNGYLDNLKWYNWASSPVLTFADGSTQTTVTLVEELETLSLRSTGKLHEHGGQISLHRVAVHTDKVHQYASLISLQAFEVMAGMHSEGTPLDLQTVALPLNFLFPQAHAGFWGGVMGVVGFFLPVQELGIVLQQLAYAVTDPDKFEGDTFIVNLIIAATYLPPGRVLQPFAKSLGVLFRTLKGINPKFLKYFGGMFSGVISRAKKGQFDILWHMIPFFIVIAEMYNDPEARKGLEFMFRTVDSGEDILSWVEYLALPAEGWDGDGEIPEVALFEPQQPALPLGWMMNQAYAQKNVLKRISGKVAGASLAKAVNRISKESAEHLPDTLKVIVQTAKSADAAAIRKYLFKPGLLVAATGVAVRQGAKGVANFLKGKTNARYKPITFIATVAYLEWELACGRLLDIKSGEKKDATAEEKASASDNLAALECDDKGITGGKNRWEVYSLYERVLADSITKEFDEEPIVDEGENYRDFAHGHGAMYHLNQIAYYQILHRAGGKKIKAIEGNRWIWLYKDSEKRVDYEDATNRKDSNFKENIYGSYNRRVDIVLESGNGAEQWIELKSYSALSDTGPGLTKLAATKGKPFEAWGLGKGHKGSEYVLPKQFSLDRAAANVKHARMPLDEQDQNQVISVSNDFKWRFQKFKIKSPKTNKLEVSPGLGNQNDKDTIYGGLTQPIQEHQGKYKDIFETNMGKNITAKDHIEYADLKEFLQSLASIGFEEALEAIKEEEL